MRHRIHPRNHKHPLISGRRQHDAGGDLLFHRSLNHPANTAKWLYTIERRYYYAIGFNLLRISDKLGIDYKREIFKDVSW